MLLAARNPNDFAQQVVREQMPARGVRKEERRRVILKAAEPGRRRDPPLNQEACKGEKREELIFRR
jgi:hypothetical protein